MGIVALLGDLGGTNPHDAVHAERVYELSSLTWKDAKKLEGKRATFRVVVDSRPGWYGDYVLYDCDSDDDVAKVVWFKGDPKIKDMDKPVLARGRLRVLVHPGRVIDGTWFEGFREVLVKE